MQARARPTYLRKTRLKHRSPPSLTSGRDRRPPVLLLREPLQRSEQRAHHGDQRRRVDDGGVGCGRGRDVVRRGDDPSLDRRGDKRRLTADGRTDGRMDDLGRHGSENGHSI